MLGPGRYAVTDRTWASHLLSLERVAPDRSFVAASRGPPAATGGEGRRRDPAAPRRGERRGRGVRRRDRAAVRRPRRDRGRRRARPPATRARPRARRLHDRRFGPERRLGPPRAGGATDRTRRRRRDGLRGRARRLLLGPHSDRLRGRTLGRGTRGLRDRPGGPAGGVRGGPPGRRGAGRRPGGSDGDHRRGLRRSIRPSDRPWDRARGPRAPVHRGGQRDAARAGHDLLGRARDLPGGAVRRPDRGPGRRDRPGRRAAERGRPGSSRSSPDGGGPDCPGRSGSVILGVDDRESPRDGGVRPRPVPACVQARRPLRRGLGPRLGPRRDRGRGPVPRVHDGHRDPHLDLPPGPARDAGGLRAGRHGVPGVLGLRGAVARRGVQPVPGRGGLGARAGSRTGDRRFRVPVAAAEEPVDPSPARRQGTAEPRRHDARIRGDGRLRCVAHDLGCRQRALDPHVLSPPDREDPAPRARQSPERDHQGRASPLRVLPDPSSPAPRAERGRPSDHAMGDGPPVGDRRNRRASPGRDRLRGGRAVR